MALSLFLQKEDFSLFDFIYRSESHLGLILIVLLNPARGVTFYICRQRRFLISVVDAAGNLQCLSIEKPF